MVMAELSNYPPLINPISVVGPEFCAPYPVDFTIVRKLIYPEKVRFPVIDVNGNIVFQLSGDNFSLHHRRKLLDADGNSVLCMKQKIRSAHGRWQVFRGDRWDSKDLLFSAKKSSMIHLMTDLNVFEVCDFKIKIKGSWSEKSCIIYTGDSNNLIAQMNGNQSCEKETFMVTVYPNVDYDMSM